MFKWLEEFVSLRDSKVAGTTTFYDSFIRMEFYLESDQYNKWPDKLKARVRHIIDRHKKLIVQELEQEKQKFVEELKPQVIEKVNKIIKEG